MAALLMDVHDYLEVNLLEPWRWGRCDCTLFAADWALEKTGKDPGKGIRDTYHSDLGAAKVLKSYGGVFELVNRQLTKIGWNRIDGDPADGDIGVVYAPLAPTGLTGEIPAIRAGGLWVIRTMHGQRASELFPALAIWRG